MGPRRWVDRFPPALVKKIGVLGPSPPKSTPLDLENRTPLRTWGKIQGKKIKKLLNEGAAGVVLIRPPAKCFALYSPCFSPTE